MWGAGEGERGQIASITDNVDNGRGAAYTYDPLSRLSTAVTTGSTGYPKWGLSFTYDRYGNRTAQTVTAGTAPSSSLNIAAATNRITGYTYDANGNLKVEPFVPSNNNYTYDAENRMVSFSSGSASASYTYDGGNLRVKKVSGSTTTVYVFSGSKVIAEYANGSLSKEYVYSGSQLLATIAGTTTTYHHPDHLSVRLSTNSSGTKVGDQGHFPFGETWYLTNTTTKWQFTSYERDLDSGNDYAMFRYYMNRVGRFSSPDPLGGSRSDPQSLNRYAYALSDPIDLVDPLGLRTIIWKDCVTSVWADGDEHTICYIQVIDIPDFMNPGDCPPTDRGCNKEPKEPKKPKKAANTVKPPCDKGWGVGLTGGVSAEIGAGDALAAAGTASLGGGIFHDSNSGIFSGYSGGGFASGGQVHGITSLHGTPSQDMTSPGVGGVYTGGGGGFFITNAGAAGSLRDHFATYTVDTPVVSVQYSTGGGIWSLSVTFGRGALFGASAMTTNTVTRGTAKCD